MGPDAADELRFVCPTCEESLTVNPSMRDALLEEGCVICGAAVTETAFEAPASDEPQ